MKLQTLDSLKLERFETVPIYKKLSVVSRKLAEFKGLAASIPQQSILINSLGMQEAKDSSAIENIVTTHDELYLESLNPDKLTNPAAKEVSRYRQALAKGHRLVRDSGLLTVNFIQEIQGELEQNKAGFRKLPGTALKNQYGETVYIPPQDPDEIISLLRDLEKFLNDPDAFPADPLIKMAVAHHQFESIHPFYDGNGRTGRIINVLYLLKEDLLQVPSLYLSRHIVSTKPDYYRLLQKVRTDGAWEEWIIYMLTAVGVAAEGGMGTISEIKSAMLDAKHRIRDRFKFYSQDLINTLFTNPYTKIEFVERDLGVSRVTAARYLEQLTEAGFLEKRKLGRSNFYVNTALMDILSRQF